MAEKVRLKLGWIKKQRIPPDFQEFTKQWGPACPTVQELEIAYLTWLFQHYKNASHTAKAAGISRTKFGYLIGIWKRPKRKVSEKDPIP